ncbi:hypothetical protein glysoja_027584 [Glycine soja]|uniref:Uncharacterized protein n=1 Tax=Glycine soja TaxID=3848 RepID=A0A0B2QMR6_GLYSO|nr:hypothetical protein glysoja_027584 [Glycine soja]
MTVSPTHSNTASAKGTSSSLLLLHAKTPSPLLPFPFHHYMHRFSSHLVHELIPFQILAFERDLVLHGIGMCAG